MIKSILLILNIVAATNGVLLALILFAQERFGSAQVRLAFAGFIFLLSVLLGIFVALDTGAITISGWLAVATDVFALTASACFFSYIWAISGKSPHPVIFAPVFIYLFTVVGAGGRYLPPTNIAPIIGIQTTYTLAAIFVYVASRSGLPKAIIQRRENRQLPALFAGVGLLHGAQILRLLFPHNNIFFDLVPFVGAFGLVLIVLYGIMGSQTLAGFGKAPHPTGPQKVDEIESAILGNKAYLDPDLSLQKFASTVNLTPRELSEYLNQVKGQPFREFINEKRIDHSLLFLAQPEEARTSIEAAALLCGFRSRSSFYEAFKKRTGITPAEYRNRHTPGA